MTTSRSTLEKGSQTRLEAAEAQVLDGKPDRQAPLPARVSSVSRRHHAGYVYHRLLAVSDFAAILLAAVTSAVVAGLIGQGPETSSFQIVLAVMTPVWFFIAYLAGLYHITDQRFSQDFVDEIGVVAVSAAVWSWGFAVLLSMVSSGMANLTAPALLWVSMILFLMVLRGLVRDIAKRRSWYRRPVAAIGDKFGLSALADRMERHPEWALDLRTEVVTNIDGKFLLRRSGQAGSTHQTSEDGLEIGNQELVEHLLEHDVERAIIAGNSGSFSFHSELVRKLVDHGIVVDFIAGGPDTVYTGTSLHHLEGMTVMSTKPSSRQPFALVLKRILDVSVAASFLLLSAPILVVSAIAIRLDSPGSVLFRQSRGGRHGETFEVVKLRTMRTDADQMRDELRESGDLGDGEMLKIKDDPRITTVGKYLRAWSLDEIPQLWNVLIGEMSLVGPRPLPLDEAAFVTEDYKAREKMKPGITGPWQVMGRSEIPMQDMLKLDYTYVVGWSFLEDVKLLLRTFSAVATRTGAH